ncbi:uncharacterized protein LOC124795981 [Schistocerca piceifrons]|uniref:uncharacterized protein LOC124795981 n=1 Tax=Schistocerca piceifrons TaxID=274613 RepID=UPI001F5F31AF|nr:uncharacterized protein LOC124795981 [Schistocerca piceifrons]
MAVTNIRSVSQKEKKKWGRGRGFWDKGATHEKTVSGDPVFVKCRDRGRGRKREAASASASARGAPLEGASGVNQCAPHRWRHGAGATDSAPPGSTLGARACFPAQSGKRSASHSRRSTSSGAVATAAGSEPETGQWPVDKEGMRATGCTVDASLWNVSPAAARRLLLACRSAEAPVWRQQRPLPPPARWPTAAKLGAARRWRCLSAVVADSSALLAAAATDRRPPAPRQSAAAGSSFSPPVPDSSGINAEQPRPAARHCPHKSRPSSRRMLGAASQNPLLKSGHKPQKTPPAELAYRMEE